MAIISEWRYGVEGTAFGAPYENFTNLMGATDSVWASTSTTAQANLEVGAWAPATIVMNGAIFQGTANNNRLVGTNEISVNEAVATPLNGANLSETKATLRISWSDDALNTVLSNIKFYAFDGTDPNIPPSNVTAVAYCIDGTTVYKNRVGGDINGLAWEANNGVNTVVHALDIPDRPSSAEHVFFIGVSAKVNAYGLHDSGQLRLSFDVS